MAPIIWDTAWNIGCEEVDRQHHKWVELFNGLENAFLSGGKVLEVQKDTLKGVMDYTHYHFASEEKLMKEADYPESSSHRRLHKEFDTHVYEKFRSQEDGEFVLSSEILLLMKNWLLRHIQVEDQKLGRYLKTRQ
jgi:hemerythrin